MSNKYPNGVVTHKISNVLGRLRERKKWRMSCQRLNAMKMSERCPCLLKGRLYKQKGIFLIPVFVSDGKLYMAGGITCNLIRCKIIKQRLAPTCSMEDYCTAISYPLNRKAQLWVASEVFRVHRMQPRVLCIYGICLWCDLCCSWNVWQTLNLRVGCVEAGADPSMERSQRTAPCIPQRHSPHLS